MDQVELMTPLEVAEAFRVDTKTVSRWAKAGKLRSIRTPGGHRRFLAAEVHRHLEPVTRPPSVGAQRSPEN